MINERHCERSEATKKPTKMATWKNTQKSLNLPDTELSKKVKKRIAEYEKDTQDLAAVKEALKTGKLSQGDKEEAEIAVKQLEKRIFDANELLTKDVIRLHRDMDINKKRRETLAANPGKGRGHKKNAPAAASAAIATGSAVDGKQTTPAAEPAPVIAAGSVADGKQTKPSAEPKPAAKPSDPVIGAKGKQKKNYLAGAILGSIVAFVVGAVVGKRI